MTVAFLAAVPMVAPAPNPPRPAKAIHDYYSMTVSPCTKVCTLDPVSGLCSGCGRSLAEIERWPRMSDAERAELMAVLERRLRELGRVAS